MAGEVETSETLDFERLRPIQVVLEIVHGFAIILGLSVLWLMEVVRDRVFRMLDRLDARPRPRPASAFPPGQPRKRTPRRAY